MVKNFLVKKVIHNRVDQIRMLCNEYRNPDSYYYQNTQALEISLDIAFCLLKHGFIDFNKFELLVKIILRKYVD